MTTRSDYDTAKQNLIIGAICYVVGIVCAVGGHLHAQPLDLGRLLFYETDDIRVYAFVISTLLGVVLMGIPFVKLNFVKKIFSLIFYLITHDKAKLEFLSKTGADSIIEEKYDKDGNIVFGEDKSRFRVIVECVLGIILMTAGGLILYVVGAAVGIVVLIVQLIYVIANRNKNFEDSAV